MPKPIYKTEGELSLVLAYKFSLTQKQQSDFNAKASEITDKYGYRLTLRASLDNAIRLFILGNTDKNVEDIVDLSKLPKEEIIGYYNAFFDMMDDTKEGRSRADCARALADVHKKALAKIKAYKVPLEPTNTAENILKRQEFNHVLRTMYVDFSQDMQFMTDGIHGGNDLTEVRQAYEEIYPVEERSMDEAKFAAFTDFHTLNRDFLRQSLEKRNKPKAALHLEMIRENDKQTITQTIDQNGEQKTVRKPVEEYPLYNTVYLRVFAEGASVPGQNLNATVEEIDGYLNGKVSESPIHHVFNNAVNSAIDRINSTMETSLSEEANNISSRPLNRYLELVPENPPMDLLKLPPEKISVLEKVYHDTFYKLYSGAHVYPMYEDGKDAWDMMKIGNLSVREYFGNKYAEYPKEKQVLAFKLETLLYLLTNPEGITCTYMVYDEAKHPVLHPNTYRIKGVTDSFTLTYDATDNNIITANDASDFLNLPERFAGETKFDSVAANYKTQLNGLFYNQEKIMEANHLDIFDCIYIDNESVNEIYLKRFAKYLPDKNPEDVKRMIIAAESFLSSKTIYATILSGPKDGQLVQTPMPLCFDGTGFSYVPAQKRNTRGFIDLAKSKAVDFLNKRGNLKNNVEEERKAVLETAEDIQKDDFSAAYKTEYQDRLRKIRAAVDVGNPIVGQFYYSYMLPKLEEMEYDVSQKMMRIELLKSASRFTSNDALKTEFENEIAEIRKDQAVVEYGKILDALEYSYGLKALENEDYVKLNNHLTERYQIKLVHFPIDANKNLKFRPVELKLGHYSDVENNAMLAAEYVRYIYINSSFARDSLNPFGKMVLIDGSPAEGDDPEKIGRMIAKAISEGKHVDLFIPPYQGEASHVSSLPVSIIASTPAEVDARIQDENRNRQNAGKTELLAQFGNNVLRESADTKIGIQAIYTASKKLFDVMLKISDLEKIGFFAGDPVDSLYNQMELKYFPGGKPVVNKKASKTEPGKPVGDIRNIRSNPATYIVLRLCKKSLERQLEGKEPYTVEEIVNINGLEEEKKEIAKEYTRICEENDFILYNKQLIEGADALLKLYADKDAIRNAAENEESFHNFLLGDTGILFGCFLFDAFQEIMLKDNQDVQQYYNLYQDINQNNLVEDLMSYAQITKCFTVPYDGIYQCLFKGEVCGGDRDGIASLLTLEWNRELIKVNHELGVNPLSFISNTFSMPMTSGFENSEILRNIINQPDGKGLKQLAEGTLLSANNIYIDFHSYFFALVKNPNVSIDSYLRVIPPENVAEIAAFKKSVHENMLNYFEEDALKLRTTRVEEDLKTLYSKEGDHKTYSKIVFGEHCKSINELSEEDITRAAELYDKIFAPLMNRDAVKAYLAANQNLREFDLFHVGGNTVEVFFRNNQGLNNQNPLHEAQLEKNSPNEIARRKAEIITLMANGKTPLTYDVIRMDASQRPFVQKQEYIFRDELTSRISEEFPQLSNLNTSKEDYAQKNGLSIVQMRNISEDDLNRRYHLQLTEVIDKLLPDKKVIPKTETDNTFRKLGAENRGFYRLSTLFGTKTKFVSDWANDLFNLYSQESFTSALKDKEKGEFTEEEFVTLSYLASLNPDIVHPDTAENVMTHQGEHNRSAFYRGLGKYTDNFFRGDGLGNSGFQERFLFTRIAPARNAAQDAILSFSNEEPDVVPMANAMKGGIKSLLMMAKCVDNISDPQSIFWHYANMLERTDAILSKNEALRTDVESGLTEEEKVELKNILSLQSLRKEKTAAEEALKKEQEEKIKAEEARRKKQKEEKEVEDKPENEEIEKFELKPETRLEYVMKISDFSYAVGIWKDNYNRFIRSNEYRTLEQSVSQRVQVAASNQLKDALNFEKKEFIMQNLHHDPALNDFLHNKGRKAEIVSNRDSVLQKLEEALDYLLKESEKQAKAMDINYMDHGVMNPAKYLEMNRAYQCSRMNEEYAKEILSEFLTDEMIKNAADRFAKKYPDSEIGKNITNKVQFSIVIFGELYKKGLEGFLQELNYEMASQMDKLQEDKLDSIIKFKDPYQTINSEKGYENHLEYPFKERIALLKNSLQENELKAADEEMLDAVNNHLAKIKPKASGLFEKAFNLDPIYENRYQNAERKKDDFDFNAAKQNPVKNSEETRQKIVAIMKQMADMGLLPAGEALLTYRENGNLVFGKLIEKKQNLMAAVNAPGENLANIRTAKTEYEAEMNKINTLCNAIVGAFPDAAGGTAGLKGTFEREIPFELAADQKMVTLLNGLYLLACQAKLANMDPEHPDNVFDAFLNDPIAASDAITSKAIVGHNFDVKVKAAGFPNTVACFNDLVDNASHTNSFVREVYGSTNGVRNAIEKPLEILANLETDKEISENLYCQTKAIGEAQKANLAPTKAYFELFRKLNDPTPAKEVVDIVKGGLKCAFFKGDSLKESYFPGVLNPGEKPAEYDRLLATEGCYDILKQNYNSLKPLIMSSNKAVLKEAVLDMMFDYLLAHPDINDPDYKAFEKFATDAQRELGVVSERYAEYTQTKANIEPEITKLKDALTKFEETANKTFENEQKEINVINSKIDRLERKARTPQNVAQINKLKEERDERLSKFNNMIDEHRAELTIEYQMRNITLNYFEARMQQLNSLEWNKAVNTDYKNLPPLMETNDLKQLSSNYKMIQDRICKRIYPEHLSTIDNYKNRMVNDMTNGIDYETELDEDSWKMLYERELKAYAVKNVALPTGYKSADAIFKKINDRNEKIQHLKTSFTVTESLNFQEEPAGAVFNQNSLANRIGTLKEKIQMVPDKFFNMEAVGEDAFRERANYKDVIYIEIAKGIGIAMMVEKGGEFNNSAMLTSVANSIKENQQFKDIIQPVLEKVYLECLAGKHIRSFDDKPHFWRDVLAEMINDKSVISALALELEESRRVAALQNQNQPNAGAVQGQQAQAGVNRHPGLEQIKRIIEEKQFELDKQAGLNPQRAVRGRHIIQRQPQQAPNGQQPQQAPNGQQPQQAPNGQQPQQAPNGPQAPQGNNGPGIH